MRHKYFILGGMYDIENLAKSVYLNIRTIRTTPNYPFKGDRLGKEELSDIWQKVAGMGMRDTVEFGKISDGLYVRLANGSPDTDFMDFLVVLPETHPGFNFDIFYYNYCTGYGAFEHLYKDEHLKAIIINTFPDIFKNFKV